MLLAHLPDRHPLAHHHPPADRSLQAPRLPFTLICRDAGNHDSCLAFHRYAYLEDCIHDLRLALNELYLDADEYHSHHPDSVDNLVRITDIYAHGKHRLTVTATGYDQHETGHWSQVWDLLAKPFVLYTTDTDPSRYPDISPF